MADPLSALSQIPREKIRSITFLDSCTDAPEDAWDLSEAKDGTVLAWATENESSYDVYIAGKVSLSGAPQVKSLTVPADKLTVGALESGADITVIGTGVVAKNVETDVSAYFKAADAAQKVVYNAAEKTLTVQ